MTLGKRLLLGAVVGIALVLLLRGCPTSISPLGPSQLTLVGVYESADLSKYDIGQRAWLRGEPFRTKVEGAGHSYYVVDKDIKDKDNQRPADLVPFLDAVKETKLPALTVRRAGTTDVKTYLPKTVAEAEQAVKDNGG